MPEKDPYAVEREWIEAIREFTWRCLKKWPGWLGGGIMSLSAYFIQLGALTMPRWFVLWSGIAAGAVISAFCVWREDKKKMTELITEINTLKQTSLDKREEVLLDAVEHIKNGAYPFWSLHLAKADLLGSNDDVLWVAEMLAKHGHENPFELIEGLIEPSNYRAFLVAIRLGGENLRTEQDVVIYLCNKLHKNGPKPSSRITDMKAEVE